MADKFVKVFDQHEGEKTCGYVEHGVICGKPGVEHIDINFKGFVSRLWLCADHSDHRQEFLDGDIIGGGTFS